MRRWSVSAFPKKLCYLLWIGPVLGLSTGVPLLTVIVLAVFVACFVLWAVAQAVRHVFVRSAVTRREAAVRQRDRDAVARMAAERERVRREAEAAAPAKAAGQRRREDARARCELLFSLYAPEIGQRFPRALLDDFVRNYMGDERSPETVEQRSEQLQGILLQHLEKSGQSTKRVTLADLAQWFLREKEQIEATPLQDEDRENLLAQLEARFARLQEKYIRGMQP
jgi:hypothetical protein